jgi:Kef-type K+ transport system membrane component KefB
VNEYFVPNMAIILISGFIAGTICKYLKASPLIGYLVIGAIIGPGCLDLTNVRAYQRAKASHEERIERDAREEEARRADEEGWQSAATGIDDDDPFAAAPSLESENAELRRELASARLELEERNARKGSAEDASAEDEFAKMEEGRFALQAATEFGVLLLLFSIGIEFTFAQLTATAKYMFIGGMLQMGETIALGILICVIFKMGWVAGLALGSVVALSSTALVYKTLCDLGRADTRRHAAHEGDPRRPHLPGYRARAATAHSADRPRDNRRTRRLLFP